MAGALVKRAHGRKRASAHGSHSLQAEINVTPFVDVMLVLLIVFMVSAPLITIGVPVNLPKASGQTFDTPEEPITVTVSEAGDWFVGDQPVVGAKGLLVAVEQATDGNQDRKIFIRGDSAVSYGQVMEAMHPLTKAGYRKLALITSQPLSNDS